MTPPKILVIEDESIIHIEIEQKLQKLGYYVSKITDLKDDTIQKICEANPTLVLLGSYLLQSKKNAEIADVIQKKLNIPVLYLTSDSKDKKLDQYDKTCILNNYDDKELYTTIEIAIHQQQFKVRTQQERRKWLTAINSMGSAVIITDVHGKIEVINSMAETLTGWYQSEALAINVEEVLKIIDSHTGEKNRLFGSTGNGDR
ncbi:COG2199: FOG: GGDEF domain [Richelia intracellularis]|nr:COG2199: FOG: GGDEF domain [Richelia intracellularis]